MDLFGTPVESEVVFRREITNCISFHDEVIWKSRKVDSLTPPEFSELQRFVVVVVLFCFVFYCVDRSHLLYVISHHVKSV